MPKDPEARPLLKSRRARLALGGIGLLLVAWLLTTATDRGWIPRPEGQVEPVRLGEPVGEQDGIELAFDWVSSSSFHWPWESGHTVEAEFTMPDGGLAVTTGRVNLEGSDWWAGVTRPSWPEATRTVDFRFEYDGVEYHLQADVVFEYAGREWDPKHRNPLNESNVNSVYVSDDIRRVS